MNWKEKLKKVAEVLGLAAKVEQKALTNEEFQQILDAYQRDYQVTLRDDIAAGNASQLQQAEEQQRQEMLEQIYSALVAAGAAAPVPDASPSGSAPVPDGSAPVSGASAPVPAGSPSGAQTVSMDGIVNAINQLGQQVRSLSRQPADDVPEQRGRAAVVVSAMGPGTTPEFLFGITAPVYSMQKRWNQIAANPGMAAALGAPGEETYAEFRQAVLQFAGAVRERARFLIENRMTADLKALSEGQFSTTYAPGVANLGDMATQYTVRRQDAIIARVLSTVQLTQWFPVRYGIQDNDIIFNAFFGEVSQAYQQGEVYKGGMQLENERGYVDDVMIKMKWGPMKELERKYIAYLNTSGSDPIKWSMVEYQLLNSLLTAQREQNIRRMRGIYVSPESGAAGSYLNGSTGLLYRLVDYIHSNRLLVTEDEDKSYRRYTQSTMLAAVQAFVADVQANLQEDEDLSGKVLYLNARHKAWWLKCIRTQFHLDTDFHGVDSYANVVPDTNVSIVWLPYLGHTCFMMMQEPGNLQFLEFLPGEMMNVHMDQQMEQVRAWSTWKEGTAAAFLGRKFATRAALVANDYKWQQIFLNKFCASLAADAVKADAADGFWLETAANTQATALTDIEGAAPGVAYVIECGSTTNATTVAKSDKFSEIKSNWTPTAVGDYLMVILNTAGTKFLELERTVGGVRTINADLNPHYVG